MEVRNLTIIPRYGLANRMRALASGIILGEEMGYQTRFYWEENELCHCSFSRLFDSDLVECGKPVMINTDETAFFSKEKMMSWEIEIVEGDQGKDLVVESFNPFILKGAEKGSFESRLSGKIRDIFLPSEEVAGKFIDLPEECIGIHVRRKDNVSSRRESTDEAFMASMDRELARDRRACFFLSTDSEEVKMRMVEKYGASKIFTREIDQRRSSDSGIIDAVVDMFMLSRTNKILGSYGSSFSTIAGFLGDIPQYPVIDQRARDRSEQEKGEIDRLLEGAERDMENAEFGSAISKFESIRDSFPYYYGIQMRLANAYEAIGDYKKAKASILEYMRDYPFAEDANRILKRIEGKMEDQSARK